MIITWTAPGGTSVEFSKDSDTYKFLKEYTGFTFADAQYRTTDSPYQDGVTILDTNFIPRKVTIPLMVTAPSLEDIQAAVLYLIRLFNPKPGVGELKFTYENGNNYYLSCVGTVTPSATIRGSNWQMVTISLTAHDPLWYGDYQVASLGTATTKTFPMTFPFTLAPNLAQASLTNAGDVAAPVTIVITGDVTNPKIKNTNTDEFFEFTRNMDESDVMTITTGFGNKTITYYDATAGTTVNGFQYLDADSVFWQLIPGANNILFTSDAVDPTTTVSITWRDRYSGV